MLRVLLLLLGQYYLVITCEAFVVSHQGTSKSSALSMAGASAKDLDVTVIGGTGFVGSRVCKLLVEKGAKVTSVSTSGTVPKWAADDSWVNDVTWKATNLLTATPKELDASLGKPKAVISCVGAIGTDPDELLAGNGEANGNAFASAKRVKASSVAYVSVSPEVAACKDGWLPDFFGSYFEGKEMAEKAAKDVCSDVTIVCPSFIYGGDSFGLTPPRVNTAYGALIDQLLSFGLIQTVADVAPGLIKVALRPPVAVESVAGACVAGILSEESGVTVLDTSSAINEASGQAASTGLDDAIAWSLQTAGEIGDWIRAQTRNQAYKP